MKVDIQMDLDRIQAQIITELANEIGQLSTRHDDIATVKYCKAHLIRYTRCMIDRHLSGTGSLYANLDLKQGPFAHDLVTATQIAEFMQITPVQAGMLLRDNKECIKKSTQGAEGSKSVWIIRNHQKYLGMRSSVLYRAHADTLAPSFM